MALATGTPLPDDPQVDPKPVNILARSLYRQMREQGFSADQIIGLSSALIEEVRGDLQKNLAAE